MVKQKCLGVSKGYVTSVLNTAEYNSLSGAYVLDSACCFSQEK